MPQESAVLSAHRTADTQGQPFKVDHPLLDKVRACSANPEKAADFFLWILHPISTRRLSAEACYHPYLESTYVRMLDEFPLPESHPCHEAVLMERNLSYMQHLCHRGVSFVLVIGTRLMAHSYFGLVKLQPRNCEFFNNLEWNYS